MIQSLRARRRSRHHVQLEPLEPRCLLTGGADPGFGEGGQASLPAPAALFDIAASVLQPDGKTVIVGSRASRSQEFLVARLNADGSPDSSFGNGGQATLAPPGIASARAYDVALQADGKIVVAGAHARTTFSSMAVARLNADGSPDTSFDDDGIVIIPRPSGPLPDLAAGGILVQPDGRIVIAGGVAPNHVGTYDLPVEVVRLMPSGALDTSFASDGRLAISFEGLAPSISTARSIVRQPDGKLVVGATSSQRSGDTMAVARVNANGTIDMSFGDNGRQVIDFPEGALTYSVLVLPGGEIVLTGSSGHSSAIGQGYGLIAAKFTSAGQIDTSFGNLGRTQVPLSRPGTFPLDRYEGGDSTLDGNRIVMIGTQGTSDRSSNAVLVGLTFDGRLDTSFTPGGTLAINFGGTDRGASVFVGPDRKLTAVGLSDRGSSHAFAAARFLAGGGTGPTTPPTTPPPTGPGDPSQPPPVIIPGRPSLPPPVGDPGDRIPLPPGPRISSLAFERWGRRTMLVIRFDARMFELLPDGSPVVEIRHPGRDGRFFTRTDLVRRVPRAQFVDANRTVMAIPIAGLRPPTQPLMITVNPARLTNMTGQRLDGDGDGQPGGTFVTTLG